jgi:hypothetical protein
MASLLNISSRGWRCSIEVTAKQILGFQQGRFQVELVPKGILKQLLQALFDDAKLFYDVNVVNETRNKTYERLAKIGAKIGLNEKEFYNLLHISDKPDKDGSLNTGNQVTNDLKVLVKMNRMQGVHVTPTVVFNGVVENNISSSFSGEQWEEWLEKNVI